MAIYHLDVKMISRSSGRSAVAAASYRSGEQLHDERQDQTFNYRGKQEQVVFSEILTPEGAPEWMQDREKLWNVAEACENRKDSQVAREIEIALPKELSVSENAVLLREFVTEQFVKEGLVADVNIHSEDRGNENIHAHVMLTTRRVIEDGFDEKKARDLDKKEMLLAWREEWATKVNHHLALNGHDIRIDHRSYQEQEIDLEPQNKRGPEIARDRLTEKVQEHHDIAARNGERIYEDPGIAIKAISAQQSTFTKQDIARFVNRHTVDQEQFSRVFEKVYASPELLLLGQDQKSQERYSTQEMVTLEKEMLDMAQSLSERSTHDISNPEHDRFSMAISRIGHEIKSMFSVEEEKDFHYSTLSEEQKMAVEHITKGNDLSCVLGYAGTGKSYMLGSARELWEKEGYQVRGLALAGITARGLEDGSGIRSQTIARQFITWENGREQLSERDVVVVDEVGMVASRQFHRLLGYVQESGAKLVLTGDFNQIPPIEAGAAARAVMEQIGYVELTEIRRQVEPWQQETTKQFARGEIDAAIDNYYQKGCVHIGSSYGSAENKMIDKWAYNLAHRPEQSQMMIAFTNKEVDQLNRMARSRKSEMGLLGGKEHEVETNKGTLKLAEWDKILFLKNNKDLGVMNGMIGEVRGIHEDKIAVVINKFKENEREIIFNTKDYNHLSYGYAATAHKIQGATFGYTQTLISQYFNKNIGYVANTRHQFEHDIYHNFKNNQELKSVLNREGGKDTTLDYPSTLSPEVLKYREIQPLKELEYTTFHHRELIKELSLTGEKEVSFDTGKKEIGLIAGSIEHNHNKYIVMEQDKEFKMYDQKLFFHNEIEQFKNSIGHFVEIEKDWNNYHQSYETYISDKGAPIIEAKELSCGKGAGEIRP